MGTVGADARVHGRLLSLTCKELAVKHGRRAAMCPRFPLPCTSPWWLTVAVAAAAPLSVCRYAEATHIVTKACMLCFTGFLLVANRHCRCIFSPLLAGTRRQPRL